LISSVDNNKNCSEINNSPLISIITVVLNGEDVLEETILSVIKQTYQNIQYIVVDGNSKDNTVNIIKKFNRSIDQWISKDDHGIYDAMNTGASMAKGDLIGFLNAGDTLFPETIYDLALGFQEKNFDYSFGSIVVEDKFGRKLGINEPVDDINQNNFFIMPMPSPHMGVYMKKNLFHKLNGYDLKFSLSADYDLLLRSINLSKKVWFFKSPVGTFKVGGVSGSFKTHLENYMVHRKHSVAFFKRLFLLAHSMLRAFVSSLFFDRTVYKIKLFFNLK
jgi:glycosyltransferase involved in cell wall biosynthesis